MTITVAPDNDRPVAVGNSYTIVEDTLRTIAAPGVLGNDTDVDGVASVAKLVAAPAHGSLTLNSDGSFLYTPNANYFGGDSFTYRANDGSLDSTNVAVVTLTVSSDNDAPVAVGNSYSTAEDQALTVTAPGLLGNDTDADGDALSARLGTGPSSGTLTLNSDGPFTYTPGANFNGTDTFTYRARDIFSADSNPAVVTITVTPVNDAPVAVNDTYNADEDGGKHLWSSLQQCQRGGDGLSGARAQEFVRCFQQGTVWHRSQ